MTNITNIELQEFITIYKNEFWIELSSEEALKLAIPLLNLLKTTLFFNENNNDF